jgi:chromosome partitioning protein
VTGCNVKQSETITGQLGRSHGRNRIRKKETAMPVISYANSKGGSGKTTAALLTACSLARTGDVAIIDADPRQPISSWAAKREAGLPAGLSLVADVTENNVFDVIERARETFDYVVIDLEGTASKLTGVATTSSDLIIVPTMEMQQDAEAALNVLQVLDRDFKQFRRTVPYAILFSRTKHVKSRTEAFINKQFRQKPNLCFDRELMQRDAYAQIFVRGATLYEIPTKEVTGVDKAIAELDGLVSEIQARLGHSNAEQKGAA